LEQLLPLLVVISSGRKSNKVQDHDEEDLWQIPGTTTAKKPKKNKMKKMKTKEADAADKKQWAGYGDKDVDTRLPFEETVNTERPPTPKEAHGKESLIKAYD